MQIIPKQPSIKGPAEWFTGDVYIDPIARGEEPSRIQVNAVHFTPGADSVALARTRAVALRHRRGGADSEPGGRSPRDPRR